MKNLYILCMALLFAGCQSSFLDVKPSMQTVVPISLDDFESLLYDPIFRNQSPLATNLTGSDEYYVLDGTYASFTTGLDAVWAKYAYTWEQHIHTGQEYQMDWSNAYKNILQANVILEGLETVQPSTGEQLRWNRVKGMALFHRAFAYYCLTQTYCPVYRDENSAKSELGLPLRTKGNPTLNPQRSSLAETYRFILADLQEVVRLIPENSLQRDKMDPTAEAGHALLTRAYMQMGDYEAAEQHARACVKYKHELLDYRSLDKNLIMPFPALGKGNPEVLYYAKVISSGITLAGAMHVSTDFMNLYEEGDLRVPLFFGDFRGLPMLEGSYSGLAYTPFGGIGLDEVYLNLAECLARRGAVEEALSYLNELREHRFETEKFVAYSGLVKEETLLNVLKERKRQLYFRGLRWEDLRRLNKEPRFQTAIHRTIAGVTYTLEPGSNFWTWPIPPTAIANGGYVQNPR